MACTAPRPFWNAVAPMLAAASMRERASRSPPYLAGARQVGLDEAHAFERDAVRQRMEARRAEGLEAMHEGIEARGRGDLRRQSDRELRIRDHDARHHLRMEDDLLLMRLLVEDDAGAADFAARAGGGRHRDDRRDALGIRARPPVADVLEVPQRPRLPRHERDDLAGIEPGAATEGDDAIVRAGVIGLEAGLDVRRHRIAAHIGE